LPHGVQIGCGEVPERALPALDASDALRVDVEAQDRKPVLGEDTRQRQAHVAETQNPNPRSPIPDAGQQNGAQLRHGFPRGRSAIFPDFRRSASGPYGLAPVNSKSRSWARLCDRIACTRFTWASPIACRLICTTLGVTRSTFARSCSLLNLYACSD